MTRLSAELRVHAAVKSSRVVYTRPQHTFRCDNSSKKGSVRAVFLPIDTTIRLSSSPQHIAMPFSPSYDTASRVRLIKSPSLDVPDHVSFPRDVHPLPPDLQAYFVYPFSLESYVLAPNNPSARTIEEVHAKHQSFLIWRDEERKRRERERLRKLAPGWTGETAVLQPNKRGSLRASTGPSGDHSIEVNSKKEAPALQLDAMAELVEHLTKSDAAATETASTHPQSPARQSSSL